MSSSERDLAALDAAVNGLRAQLQGDEEEEEPGHPYRMTRSGIWWLKPNKDGGDPVPVRLTNFQARILRDVVEDDGLETRNLIEVEGLLPGRPAARQSVPAGQYASLAWVPELLGAQAIIETGSAIKDRARVAIQYLSEGSVERAHVYTHTGWHRLPSGEHVYLHAGGAIGSQGVASGVEVAPPGPLARFRLPEPPSGEAEREAVRASLALADAELAPDRLTIPLLAAVYRAPLGPADLSLALIGDSGLGKSELAALAQQHYGPEMDRMNLPASFLSTANFNLGIAFAAKDALLVVDEFKPTGNRLDRQRAHADANRLLTSQGNQSGRGRADTSGAPRAVREPRGLLLMTGEEVPDGYSARARSLILEVSAGDVEGLGLRASDPGYREQHLRLTGIQEAGRSGLYARALAGYLRWLADSVDRLRERVRENVAQLRNQAPGSHARTGTNVAQLMVGVAFFLEYARSVEAVTEADAEAWQERAWAALLDAAARQEGHQQRARPEQRFVELLMSAIASGRAHVADREGLMAEPPEAWGWRQRLIGSGDYIENRWEPQGSRVGWLDGTDLYLDRPAAFRAAGEMDPDGIGVTPETLTKRLHQAGYLASISSERDGRLTVRRRLEGTNRRVLHLRPSAGGGALLQQTGNSGNAGNETAALNSETASQEALSVPGSVSLCSETGNGTGNSGADSNGLCPVVPGGLGTGPGTKEGLQRGDPNSPAEAAFPESPVFPVCPGNMGSESFEGSSGGRAADPGDGTREPEP
jgi:hypothetical protein